MMTVPQSCLGAAKGDTNAQCIVAPQANNESTLTAAITGHKQCLGAAV